VRVGGRRVRTARRDRGSPLCVRGDDDAAAVDATIRYKRPDGSSSTVSSADIYEFDAAGRLTTVTSYAVELT